ncbi:AAA family ATPase [Nocardia sp. NPDC051030]|uniref:AAA family ATPase n=1 Tax=Nocardia sp. NPDC051030 TaxID=3155162 RepID=UPI00343D360A
MTFLIDDTYATVEAEVLTNPGHRRLTFTTPLSDSSLKGPWYEARDSSRQLGLGWVPVVDGGGGRWTVLDSSNTRSKADDRRVWSVEVERVVDWAATDDTVLAFGQAATFGNGVEFTVADVRCREVRHSFREPQMEGIELTVVVKNASDTRVSLDDIELTVRTGRDGRIAIPDDLGRRANFKGVLAPGKSASAVADFMIAADTEGVIDVDVSPSKYKRSKTIRSWHGTAESLLGKASGAPTVSGHYDGAELTDDVRAELLHQAVAELAALIGVEPVKQQVEILIAQLRMSRLREQHGLPGGAVPHHMVFAGPPGTGKTTVARIVGNVFAGLHLLDKGHLVEAHRADLVGGYVGHTAPRTNKVIDKALDGVLFIDEAYSLCNTRGGEDRDVYGDEALQVLLTRAEDDRQRLVIILAGYEDEMDQLLGSNPGLSSRFNTRIDFPGYAGTELAEIGRALVAESQQRLTPAADAELDSCCNEVGERGWADQLGSGRFIRTLCEKASALRDLRLARQLEVREPTADELVTLDAEDLALAFRALTARLE